MEPLEYVTLKRFLPQLQAAVKADLATITSKLRAKGVILDKNVARLKDKSKSVEERAGNLVVMVMNMVKLNPEHYNVFVGVLQQSGIVLIEPIKQKPRGTLVRSATISTMSGMEERVLIEGDLQKLGRRFKRWHQRYFRIKGSHMYYYKKPDTKCLGEINLGDCHYCEPSSFATFGAAFEILTATRSHILAAPNKEEMHRWIRAIKQNIKLSESAYARLREQATMRRQMIRKSSLPKHPPPPSVDPKAHKLSRHLSFIESDDDEDDAVDADTHREHVQAVYDLEASQSLRTLTTTTHPPPIHTSMSADALTQMVAIEEKNTKPPSNSKPPTSTTATAKPQSVKKVTKVTKGETMTMDRRTHNHPRKVSMPAITVTNTDSKDKMDNRHSYKSATLPGRGRKRAARWSTGSGESSVPKFLVNGFHWDRVRLFLDASWESMDKSLHSTLPPQDAPWTKETSAVEQLRVFLETQP